ncbi:RNA polymerase sigma factor [Streptomyces hydrogenans]|uniref:RNA polymerase sigma factor n=1 Tax=Streptomyces hydrogenans TaxID=1873719 RepID=UPI0034364EB1
MHPAAGPARTGATRPHAAAVAPVASEDSFADRLLAVYQDKRRALHGLARRELAAENLPASRADADAEDIVQDAYLITIANRDKIQTGELYAYLCTVIRNRVKDLDRRKESTPLDPTDPGAPHRAPLWVSAVQQDTDTVVDVERALQQISPQQRRLIMLSHGWDYTHAEIAELTGVHRGTVATHIRRAQTALTALLALSIVVLIVLTQWARKLSEEIGAQLPWVEVSSDGQPKSLDLGLTLTLLLYGAPASLAALALWQLRARHIRKRERRETALEARHSHILQGMVQVSDELSSAHPTGPTWQDYAARLHVPYAWVTADALANGRLDSSIPAGTVIPLHLRRSRTPFTHVRVLEDGRVKPVIEPPVSALRWSSEKGWVERPSHSSLPSGDGAEGAP